MEFEPQQPIQTERRMPWKVIIIVGGTLLLVGIAVGVILFVRVRGDRVVEERREERLVEDVKASLTVCANAPDPEACKREHVGKAAAASGTVSVCALLTAEAYDACVWDTARTQHKPDLCDAMKDTVRALRCADDVYVRIAIESGDAAMCEKVRETDRRERCLETLRGPVTSADCLGRGFDQAFCAATALFEQAIDEGNSSICDQIVDDDAANSCRAHFAALDEDNDGLTAEEETELGTGDRNADSDADGLTDGDETQAFGTDPLDPDTDDDGFKDGDEVAAGYDPRGPGRLE